MLLLPETTNCENIVTTKPEESSIGEKGTISHSGNTPADATETDVAVWAPALPTTFEKAYDATVFTRLGTWYPRKELQAAFDTTQAIN